MPVHTRDPRTLRGVRPNALAVRPDYTVPSGPVDLDISRTRVRSTGQWLLLSEEPLDGVLRVPGYVRNLWEIYYGRYAYRFHTWDQAMAAAERAGQVIKSNLELAAERRAEAARDEYMLMGRGSL